MLKDKVYEHLKKYLDKYLFGFDKSQLDVAILKGNINLKNVNLKPDRTNELIDYWNVPIAVKAGMIGSLKVKFSVMQLWQSPLEIEVEDLLLILGPNLGSQSNDESYINDEDLSAPYDENNMYNIFEHQLKVKKRKQGALRRQPSDIRDMERDIERMIQQNVKFSCKRVHIRFEDDYFSRE